MQILLHKRSLYSFAFTLVYLLLAQSAFSQNSTIILASSKTDGNDLILTNGTTLSMDAPRTFSSITVVDQAICTIDGTGLLTVSGNGSNAGTITIGSGSTLILNTNANATSLQTSDLNNTAATIRSDLNSVSLTVSSVYINTFVVNGNNQQQPNGTLVIGDNISVTTSTVEQGKSSNNSTHLKIYGNLKIIGDTRVMREGAKGIKTVICYEKSTVEYFGSSQTVYNTEYNNLILSGNGNKAISDLSTIRGNFTMTGSVSATPTFSNPSVLNTMTVHGNVTLESSAVFNASTVNLEVGGNWINNGTRAAASPNFIASSSTVIFKGTKPQSIGGSTATTFNNLTIDNQTPTTASQAPTVSLALTENVSGTLTIKNGLLVIPATETQTSLVLNNPIAVSNGGTPFSNGKHIVTQVNGSSKGVLMVNNIPISGYDYPVGNGQYYLPATIKPTVPSNFGITVFQGATTNGEPNGTAFSSEEKSKMVDAIWDVTGSVPATLTLKFPVLPGDPDLRGAEFRNANDYFQGISHYTNNQWDQTDGANDNDLFSATRYLESFSPQLVRMMSSEISLPVHFSNVRASEKSSGVQVEFTNLTESDVAYYEVERSLDGKAFSAVKRITPSKNNYGSAAYSYLDATAKEGRFTYRIKAMETTGKTIYSSLVNITLGAKNTGLTVYSKGGQVNMQVSNLPAGKYQVQLFSAAGQLLGMENISHSGGSLSQTTSLNTAKAGIYILNISGAVRMQQKFLVQ